MAASLKSSNSQYSSSTEPMHQHFPSHADISSQSSHFPHEDRKIPEPVVDTASAVHRAANSRDSGDKQSRDVKIHYRAGLTVPQATEAFRPTDQQISQSFGQNSYQGIQYPRLNHPASFADRARILTTKPADSQDVYSVENVPFSQHHRKERRASLNRPTGGVYAEIQNQNTDSTEIGSFSPWRSSILQDLQPRDKPEAIVIPHHIENIVSPTELATKRRANSVRTLHTTHEFDRQAKVPAKVWALERSPLQKLEVKLTDISKEEKRAHVEQAERNLKKSRNRIDGSNRSVGSTISPNTPKYMTASTSTAELPGLSLHRSQRRAHLVVDSDITREEKGSELDVHKQAYDHQASPTSPTQSRLPLGPQRNQNLIDLRQDRGVRFAQEDHIATRRPDSSCSIKSKAIRHSIITTGGQSHANMSAPKEQPNNVSKASDSPSGASVANQSKTSEPVLTESARSSVQVTDIDRTPQRLVNTEGRPKAGGRNETTGLSNTTSDKRHHLSDALHWRHEHTSHAHNNVAAPERPLDEWRKAGVARLTAADFSHDIRPPIADQSKVQTGEIIDRRMSTDEQNSHRGRTGKDTISHFASLRHELYSTTRSGVRPMINTRPYDIDHNSHAIEESYVSRIKASLLLHSKDARRGPMIYMPSSYSYSCSDLADHSPIHVDHLCEPYLSKELIQSMRSVRIRPVPGTATFFPPLYLKCGPLLRYTGLSRGKLHRDDILDSVQAEYENWRGSVMIVTTDIDSIYEPAPVLRLFPEPMELLPPPPKNIDASQKSDMPSEYNDPIAGLPKLSRTGKTVYVKPVDDLGEATDLSQLENDDGLFEETRTAAVPTAYGTPNFRRNQTSSQPSKILPEPSFRTGQQVKGVRLHAERGVTFWRFNIEVQLGIEQTRVAYSINGGPAIGFWVPAKGHTMNVMFHSCNGFSSSVDPDEFSGPDPLWRDVLNSHQRCPFHVMIGGGDQIYNDAVMSQSPLFREWLETRNPLHKQEANFSVQMQDELETFYLERYSMWFSQGFFGMANSQIPMINIWDDHDIIDGFGSYPHSFMHTPVFRGLGATAYHYYMLFQHQSVRTETSADEASWLTGAAPGPYINELSRSVFLYLGKHVAFLGLDCRTERTRDEIISEATYHLIFDRCRREIIEGETKHLIVLLGVPIAYPRLVWLETLLTSRMMDPIKALGRLGMMGNLLNRFDGGVEILDDLDDHWTAKIHKQERSWFIQELQALAVEKSVRITILSGDVHLAAVGQFFSDPKKCIAKDHDHRYMVNVISSAIVNTPPSEMMGDILNKRNKTHHLNQETDENMIPLFTHDVDGSIRNNKRLLPRRNWCSIKEYRPGTTSHPISSTSDPSNSSDEYIARPRPARRRTMSLTRKDVTPRNFIRRLSGQDTTPAPLPRKEENNSFEPPSAQVSEKHNRASDEQMNADSSAHPVVGGPPRQYSSFLRPRFGRFQRRPANMAMKAAARRSIDDLTSHINLENGLDIVIHCEVNQRDPAGITVPYRLVIPALTYDGPDDRGLGPLRTKSLRRQLNALKGSRQETFAEGSNGEDDRSQFLNLTVSESENEELAEQRVPRRWSSGLNQRQQYRDQISQPQREVREANYRRSLSPSDHARFHGRPQQLRHPRTWGPLRAFSDSARPVVRQLALKTTTEHSRVAVAHADTTSQRNPLTEHQEYLGNPIPQQDLNQSKRPATKSDRVLGAGNARPGVSIQNHGNASMRRISGYGEGAYDEEDFGELAKPKSTEARVEHDDIQGLGVRATQNGILDLDSKRSWRRIFA